MLNHKQQKATCHCRAEPIRHCFLFLESYWSFTFFSSLFAPQPIYVKKLITGTRAAHSSGWLTQSAKLPTQPPLSPPHIAARHTRCSCHCTWRNPCVFGHCPSNVLWCDALWWLWHPTSLLRPWLGGGREQRQPVFSLFSWDNNCDEIQEKVKYSCSKKALSNYADWDRYCNSHNFHVPSWKLIMGWSHSLPPLPPSKIVQPLSVFITRGERGGRHLPLRHPAPAPVTGRMLPEVDMAVLQDGKSYSPSTDL